MTQTGSVLERRVILLGPQRHRPGVAKAVADLGVSGPLAVITAGWEEREHEDTELRQSLAERTINLGLFPRADDVFSKDPAVASIMATRHRRRRELRDLYHMRLAPQLKVCRELISRTDIDQDDELLAPEVEAAIAGIKAVDEHHLGRVTALEEEAAAALVEHERPALDVHKHQLAELISQTEALLVAGGHVGTLLGLVRLFDIAHLVENRPVVAWSGGAMVASDRVVLFHDYPPQGAGDAEVFGPGLGFASGVIPMPHARHRLALDDRQRIALMARRFSPYACVALDYDSRLDSNQVAADREELESGSVPTLIQKGWSATGTARFLLVDGRVEPSISDVEVIDNTSVDPDDTRPGGLDDVAESSNETPAEAQKAIIAATKLGSKAVDKALANRTFPVQGKTSVLYAFRGDANEVKLHHWISGLPSAVPFQHVQGSDLWLLLNEIQPKARIEYKLEVRRGDHRELIKDPLNPREARDPFGANSVVSGGGYRKPEWTEPHATTRPGTVAHDALHSRVFGQERPFSVYLPARFRTGRRYPLLIIHDGHDYAEYASLVTVLDNLIHRLEVPPLIAALIQSPDRTNEYAADERHAQFIVEELIPHLEQRFPLAGPDERGLLGASFGAVASLHTAWRYPEAFGQLCLQSGSFAFTDVGTHDFGEVFDPVVDFMGRFRQQPGRPAAKIFLSAGIYETLIYFNRSILPVLQGTGAEVRLVEAFDGHNWENWRDHLRDGLTWLFPGPQWTVYE